MQVLPDGSFYEGYWKNDMMNVRGRMIRNNGEVYLGEWLNGKVEGFG